MEVIVLGDYGGNLKDYLTSDTWKFWTEMKTLFEKWTEDITEVLGAEEIGLLEMWSFIIRI